MVCDHVACIHRGFSSMQISFPTVSPGRVTSMPELSEISQISAVAPHFYQRLQSALQLQSGDAVI